MGGIRLQRLTSANSGSSLYACSGNEPPSTDLLPLLHALDFRPLRLLKSHLSISSLGGLHFSFRQVCMIAYENDSDPFVRYG